MLFGMLSPPANSSSLATPGPACASLVFKSIFMATPKTEKTAPCHQSPVQLHPEYTRYISFFTATAPQESTVVEPPSPIPWTWLLSQDDWVEQWLIIESKLSILKEFIGEQLLVGHIGLTTSKHNTSVD